MADLLQMPVVRAPDAGARELGLDVARAWMVAAPAGAGQTGLLIKRDLAR